MNDFYLSIHGEGVYKDRKLHYPIETIKFLYPECFDAAEIKNGGGMNMDNQVEGQKTIQTYNAMIEELVALEPKLAGCYISLEQAIRDIDRIAQVLKGLLAFSSIYHGTYKHI